MRYQGSQYNKRSPLANILEVVNSFLLAIIVVCFNYLVIDFLF